MNNKHFAPMNNMTMQAAPTHAQPMGRSNVASAKQLQTRTPVWLDDEDFADMYDAMTENLHMDTQKHKMATRSHKAARRMMT
ncbi:hypothetical protein [Methylobacillus sp.]|uniref:hypothetical protein n=1 Tax=Methylobacillus sp. TaxID=56818 RepID=UPI0012C75905|nr:hypothetical protein [Methylobacillus sp.]MPS48527.1 hypothetical protein [Methylobacillus sp.]